MLTENIDKLHFVAKFLVKNEVMDGEQFARAMTEDDVTVEELEAMVAEKRRRSNEENDARKRQIEENERRREEERRLEEERKKQEEAGKEQSAFAYGSLKDDKDDKDNNSH